MEDFTIYVGTYGKYAIGNLNGEWVDASDFQDKEAFLEECATIHSDESEPEFMLQDFGSGIPDCFQSGHIDANLWDYLALADFERELVEAYLDNTGNEFYSNTLEQAQDSFVSQGEDYMSALEEYAIDSDLLGELSESLHSYFNLESWGDDNFTSNYFKGRCYIWRH